MNDKRTRPLQLDEPIVTGNTKAAVKAAGGGSSDLWTIAPENIHYDPRDNVRPLNPARVRHIADLIKANGYDRKKPLGCFVRKVSGEDRVFVYEGQHRYHGALLAIKEGYAIDKLPCVIDAAETVSRANLIYAGINNNDSEKLTPLELAEKVVELRDLGEKDSEIARRLSVTDQTLRDVTLLADAPSPIHKLIRSNTVSSTLAIEEIRTHGPAKALERLQKGAADAKAAGKARVTKKHLAKGAAPSAPAPKKITEPQAKSLLQALQAVLHDRGFGSLSAGARDAVHRALGPLADLLDAKPAQRTWPVNAPNEHGVCKPLETLDGPANNGRIKHPMAHIRIAQAAPGIWIHAIEYNTGTSFSSAPLKVVPRAIAAWTRVQAIRDGAVHLRKTIKSHEPHTPKGEMAKLKLVDAWIGTLLEIPDPDWTAETAKATVKGQRPDLTDLLAAIEDKRRTAAGRALLEKALPGTTTLAEQPEPAKPGLDLRSAWPFPIGGDTRNWSGQ